MTQIITIISNPPSNFPGIIINSKGAFLSSTAGLNPTVDAGFVGNVCVLTTNLTSPVFSEGINAPNIAIDVLGVVSIQAPLVTDETRQINARVTGLFDGASYTIDRQIILTGKYSGAGPVIVNQAPTAINISWNSGFEMGVIPEMTPVGTKVGILAAVDSLSDTISYLKVSGDNRFIVVNNEIRVALQLDFETGNTAPSIVVRATDNGGLIYERPVSMAISNINETPTAISISWLGDFVGGIIPENTEIGTNIATLWANDVDADELLTYFKTQGDARFTVVGSNIVVAQALNFEAGNNNVNMVIQVSDTGNLTYSRTVIMSVANVNEAPTGISLSWFGAYASGFIPESTPAGTNVATLSAFDPDSGDTFTFTKLSGDARFIVSGNNITVSEVLDYEVGSSIANIIVQVTDSEGLTFSATVNMNILNVNETPASLAVTWNAAFSGGTIISDTPVNSVLGTLSATDPDTNDVLTYSKVSGDNRFSVTGNTIVLVSDPSVGSTAPSIVVRVTDIADLSVDRTVNFNIQAAVVAGPAPAFTELKRSVTKNDVTYTFEADTLVGQYANGDYFAKSPVNIISISPNSVVQASITISDGRTFVNRTIHGVMINPGNAARYGMTTAQNIKGSNQGYDSLIPGTSLNGYTHDYNKDPSITGSPLVFAANAEGSVVKAISQLTGSQIPGSGRPLLKSMEVLTVVAEIPLAGALRPAIAVADKTAKIFLSHFDFSSNVLQNLPVPATVPPGMAISAAPPGFAATAAFVSRMHQVQYTQNTLSRNISPSDNHPEYGQDIGRRISDAMLQVHLTGTVAEKRPTCVGLVQIAADIQGRINEGGNFTVNGGGETWRKGPVVFAAAILAGSAAGTAMAATAAQTTRFTEDSQVYRTPSSYPDTPRAYNTTGGPPYFISGGTGYALNQIVTLVGGVFATPAQFTITAISATGGIPTAITLLNAPNYIEEPGSLAATTVNTGAGTGLRITNTRPFSGYLPLMVDDEEWTNNPTLPTLSGSNWNSVYRDIVMSAGFGQVLAARLLPSGQALWSNPAIFGYYDRVWSYEKNNNVNLSNGLSGFSWTMWNSYRNDTATTVPVVVSTDANSVPVQGSYTNGNYVFTRFDVLLDPTYMPSIADFIVKKNGVVQTIDRVYVHGSKIGVRITTAMVGSDTITFTYIPGATRLRNVRGINVAAFTDLFANNTTGARVPAPASINMVSNTNGNGVAAASQMIVDKDVDPATGTNIQRLMVGIIYRNRTVPAGSALLMGNGISPSTSNSLFQMIGSGIRCAFMGERLQFPLSLIQEANVDRAIWFTWDSTKAAAANGGQWLTVDGAPAVNGSPIWTANKLLSTAGLFPSGLGLYGATNATTYDGAIKAIWVHWETAAGTEIPQSASANPINGAVYGPNGSLGAHGENVIGVVPKLYFPMNLVEANSAGVLNRGSLRGKILKLKGAFDPDNDPAPFSLVV